MVVTGNTLGVGVTNNVAENSGQSIDQDNLARLIKVPKNIISTQEGDTIEEKIVAYINGLNYEKNQIDAEVWVEIYDVVLTPFFISAPTNGCPPFPEINIPAYHNGINPLPINGDTIYEDVEGNSPYINNIMVVNSENENGIKQGFGLINNSVWSEEISNCE
jgi:hypothetical protein